MKKFIPIIVGLITGVFSAFAQQQEIDSLHKALEKQQAQDTVRLDIFNELSYQYYLLDPSLGLQYADSAISLAASLNEKRRLAKAYAHKGHNYSAGGADSTALALYEKSIKIYEKINDYNGLARTKFSQGLIYFGRADYAESTGKHQEALAFFSREKDTFLMGNMLNSIGINYMYLNDYPNSLDSYLKAADYYKASGHAGTTDQAGIFSNIGILYKYLEKYDQALEYQEKALSIYREKKFQSGIANSLISIGNIQDINKDHSRAVRNYKEAYQIGSKISNKRIMAASLTNTGIAYYSLQDYDAALEYLNQTKTIYNDLKDDHNLAIVYNYIGEIHKARRGHETNYTDPEDMFKLALRHSREAGSARNESKALENLSALFYERRRFKDAYDFRLQAINLRDSILSLEKKEEIVRLEVQQEFREKEVQLKAENEKAQALAALRIKRQKLIRNFSILGGSGLILLAFTGLFFYKKHRDAVQTSSESEFRVRIADTELKALRAQMNPHFIFNSLNSINDFISKHETTFASQYLTKFAKLMRFTLEASEKSLVPLEEDLKVIELYLQLEAIRLDSKLSYTIEVEEDIDRENTLIPPLILQPFLENSIWHGILKKPGKGHISIRIKRENDKILCIVEDDGVGLNGTPKNFQVDKTPLGIKITQSRIDILNRQKNSNATIRLINQKEGVRVEVELPHELAY